MKNRFLAFDIETAMIIPEGVTEWGALHPMGITCAATWASDEEKPRVWCGFDECYGSITPAMSPRQVSKLVDYLEACYEDDYRIVTVNGAGFDFRELAESSGDFNVCRQLNLAHIDCFFHVLCHLGYSPGVDAMSKGMGLPGKLKDVGGALAPELWRTGEYGRVLSYVAQDVKQTLDLVMAVDSKKALSWTAKSGRRNTIQIPQWLTVAQALKLPEPDTSWMDSPWPRSKFTEWMNQAPVSSDNPFD